MSLVTRFIPYSVKIATPGVAVWINQIESTTPNGGVVLFEESSGSETDRQYVAAKEIKPTLALVTSDLSVLTTIGFAGIPISSGGGNPGVLMFGRALTGGALPTAIGSSAHLQMACSDGILIPTGIRAGHNTVAKLSMMLHAVLGTSGTSGATPFVFTTAQTIPAGQTPTSNIYCAGPVKWTVSGGSSQLCQGIGNIDVQFGIQTIIEGSDSEVYPSMSGIIARDPRIEFTTADAAVMAAIGDGISISAFSAYFRQVNQNGQRVAIGTATHASVSGTEGMITPGSLGLTHKQAGHASFIFTPTLNTNILTVSATATIPAS